MSGHWSHFLRDDRELARWAATFAAPAPAWEACPRADWILKALSRGGAHRPTLILSAADCARATLPMLPDDEQALEAIETAEAWARGEASGLDCQKAATAARSGSPIAGAATSLAEAAAHAARCWDSNDSRLDYAVASVAQLAALALARAGVPAAQQHLELVPLIRARRHPLRSPSMTEIRRSDAIAVAWDRLAEEVDETATLSAVQALCSFSLALELGLDPEHPVDPDGIVLRAVAERLQLAPRQIPLVRAAVGAARER